MESGSMIAKNWEAGKKYFTLGNVQCNTKKRFEEAKRLGLIIQVSEKVRK